MQSGKTGIDNRFCSKCSANKMGRATDSIQTAAVNEMEGHKEPLVVLEGLDSPCWAFINTWGCDALYSFPLLTSFPALHVKHVDVGRVKGNSPADRLYTELFTIYIFSLKCMWLFKARQQWYHLLCAGRNTQNKAAENCNNLLLPLTTFMVLQPCQMYGK